MKRVILLISSLLLLSFVYSQQKGGTGPVNPKYLQYQDALKYKKSTKSGSNDKIMGYIPSPNFAKFSKVKKNSQNKSLSLFPAIYDMRT